MKPPKPGVTFVERPSQNGTTETLYDRTTVEQAILEQNQRHFNQCAGTPFTVGKLQSLNWAADSTLADALLQGKAHIHTMLSNKLVQHVLHECKQTHLDISDHITTNDLKQLFKRWRESTTTSQSGRHLGIYRAIFLDQSNSTKKHFFDTDLTSLINILI